MRMCCYPIIIYNLIIAFTRAACCSSILCNDIDFMVIAYKGFFSYHSHKILDFLMQALNKDRFFLFQDNFYALKRYVLGAVAANFYFFSLCQLLSTLSIFLFFPTDNNRFLLFSS